MLIKRSHTRTALQNAMRRLYYCAYVLQSRVLQKKMQVLVVDLRGTTDEVPVIIPALDVLTSGWMEQDIKES